MSNRENEGWQHPPSESRLELTVGVGASAGGLEALREFIEGVPGNSPMAFVIVQHLAPTGPSLLPDLLRVTSKLPVHEVGESATLLPGHVYLIKPNSVLTMDGAVLRQRRAVDAAERHSTIDILFSSLAEHCGGGAAGIVLSGTGYDGTSGLLAINEKGGLALAQDLSTAKFEAMPLNAAAAGVVDRSLPPRQLYLELEKFARRRAQNRDEEREHAAILERLPEICDLFRTRLDHDFKHYKDSTLVRRIRRRMLVGGHLTIDAYLQTLTTDSAETGSLFKDLLIGVTSFFRDPEAFAYLAAEVIPALFRLTAVRTSQSACGLPAFPRARKPTPWRSFCVSTWTRCPCPRRCRSLPPT